MEAQPPPNNTGLEISGWNGYPIDFHSNVSYRCQRRMKFKDDLDLDNVQAQCLPENLWSMPEDWGQCVESMIYLVDNEFNNDDGYSLIAKQCPDPLSPPENGTVIVQHSGLQFGSVCPGRAGFQSLPMTGCESHNMQINYKSSALGATHSHNYEILVNADVQGILVALLVFTQPIIPSNLFFSGDVSIT